MDETGGIADELSKLADLHERGVLSDDEFEAQKSHVLRSISVRAIHGSMGGTTWKTLLVSPLILGICHACSPCSGPGLVGKHVEERSALCRCRPISGPRWSAEALATTGQSVSLQEGRVPHELKVTNRPDAGSIHVVS
jgi:hypothetical protein